MTAHTAATAPTLTPERDHARAAACRPSVESPVPVHAERAKKRDPATIPALAAMILEHGRLLYPLVVIVERFTSMVSRLKAGAWWPAPRSTTAAGP